MATEINNSNEIQVPENQFSWFDFFINKTTAIGSAVLLLIGVGSASYQVGRTFMENEKNLQIFDLKSAHQKDWDSLKESQIKLQAELDLIKNSKENVRKKRK